MARQDRSAWPAVTIEVEPGLPAAIDAVAERASDARSFLRAAWYAGTAGGATGIATLVARRANGTPFAAIPTLPVGPRLLGAHSVPGSYWPFRSFPIAADTSEAEMAALIAHPAARRLMAPFLRIGPVYDDDQAAGALLRAAERADWTVLRRNLGTTFRIDIAERQAAGLWPSKSSQRRIRTYEKQLTALGPIRVRHVAGDGWTPDAVDDLAAIEAQSWVGQNSDRSGAKFLTAEKRAGWLHAAADPLLAQMLTATILYVGDHPAAFTFDMLCGHVQYGIAGSYDKQYAAHSPGKFIAYRQYDVALQRGITLVDLGAGDSGYKRAQGAEPGPKILDCLIVRNRTLAALLRRKWEGSAKSGAGGIKIS